MPTTQTLIRSDKSIHDLPSISTLMHSASKKRNCSCSPSTLSLDDWNCTAPITLTESSGHREEGYMKSNTYEHMGARTHTHTHTHTHTCTHTPMTFTNSAGCRKVGYRVMHVCTYRETHVHTYMHVRSHASWCNNTNAQFKNTPCIPTHAHMHGCKCACMHTHRRTYTHARTHTHMHTTHTHLLLSQAVSKH